MVDAASGIVGASLFALGVLTTVRSRRPDAPWWRVILESRWRPIEWPLFLAFCALMLVLVGSRHTGWILVFSLPVYGFLAWYLDRHPRHLVHDPESS